MKIVHLCNYFQPKLGYQEYFLAREHARSGHEVFVITSDRYFPFPEYDKTVKNILGERIVGEVEEEKDGFLLIRLKCLFEFSARVWLLGLEERIKKINPDIVICHGMMNFSAIRISDLKSKLHFKLVFDDHMLFAVENKSFLAKIFYRLYDFKKILRSSDKPVGIAEECVNFIEKNYSFPREKIELIPLGADTKLFRFDEDLRNGFREKYLIDEKTVAITSTGKMTEDKAPHEIILAVEQNREKLQNDIVLVFVGNFDAEYKKNFDEHKKRIEKFFHVIEIPMMPNHELVSVYCGSDIAVWPNQPTASMIEALSCGIPVIGCDYLRERYKYNNGIGVKKNDINELAEAILKIANNSYLRTEMGKNGRKLIEDELSWENIGRKFLEFK